MDAASAPKFRIVKIIKVGERCDSGSEKRLR